MNQADDQAVRDIVQRSIVIDRIERLGRLLLRAALDARFIRWFRHYGGSVSAHAGITVLVAAFVHVVLVGAVVGPRNGYWLLLPSMAAVAVILLIIVQRRRSATPID